MFSLSILLFLFFEYRFAALTMLGFARLYFKKKIKINSLSDGFVKEFGKRVSFSRDGKASQTDLKIRDITA